MAKTPEGEVKKKITALLKQRNVYYFMPVQTGYGSTGLDYHCCYRGRAFFIEAKAPGKKPTDRQWDTIVKVRAAGAMAFVVYDAETLAPVEQWLDLVDQETLHVQLARPRQ